MLSIILQLKNYIKQLKYCTLIFIFLNSTSTLYSHNSKDFFKVSLNKIFTNLTSSPLVSYKVTFTTLEANKITSTYSADVFENWSSDSFFSLYKFNNEQLFVSYHNNLGLERFWFGKQSNLPELKSKEIDNKILTTAISYSSFMINPLWLNIPIDSKEDQGFLVIQAYNKNKYSNYTKVEYYINKDYIPIRILYYNSISNFPVIEILVTDYRKIDNNYFINKLEYRDNSNKKTTIIEKTEVNFNPLQPTWLESLKQIINNNINEYYTSFTLGIRTEQDIKDSLSKTNSNKEESISTNLNKKVTNNTNILDSLDNKDTNKSIQDNKFDDNSLNLQHSKKLIPNNDDLLKALEGNSNDKKDHNTDIIFPPVINKFNEPKKDKPNSLKTSKKNENLNTAVKNKSSKKVVPKVKDDTKIKRNNKSTSTSNNKLSHEKKTNNNIELKENKIIDKKSLLQNKSDSHVENKNIKPDTKNKSDDPITESYPFIKKESDNTDSKKNNLLNNLF